MPKKENSTEWAAQKQHSTNSCVSLNSHWMQIVAKWKIFLCHKLLFCGMNCIADLTLGWHTALHFLFPVSGQSQFLFLWLWFPEMDYCNTQIPALTLPLLCHSQYKIIKVFRVANQFHLFRLGFDCHSNNWPKVPPIKKYSNCTPIGIQIWNLGKGEYYPISAWLFHIAFRKTENPEFPSIC